MIIIRKANINDAFDLSNIMSLSWLDAYKNIIPLETIILINNKRLELF